MFVAKFTWKEDRPYLPSNFAINLLKKLRDSPELLKILGKIILKQEKQGFNKRVNDYRTNNTHYLPHHAVKKVSNTNSPSLNDCLMVGPPFLKNLCTILLRFHYHNGTISTYIEKMFLHVQLHDDDSNFTCFPRPTLPEKPHSELQAYCFAVVQFGSCSSSFMLAAVLNLHLNKTSSPIADNIKETIYVDNILLGSDSEKGIVQYYTQARMGKATFNLGS